MTTAPQGQTDATNGPAKAEFENRVVERLREIYAETPWLTAAEFLQGGVGLCRMVKELTDKPVMAVGAASGVGHIDESIAHLSLGMAPGTSMVDTMHKGQRLLANPPTKAQAKVDAWDPEKMARSIGSFTGVSGSLMGRPTFGARPERWRTLEDKLAIETIWTEAGIPVAKSRQVNVADVGAVLAAHDDLATDAGTVWAGDNSSGWHGGGAGTFWVPDRQAAEALVKTLDRFERIRVMPFVEGIPCSIHAMVVPDGSGGTEVLSFRPCEMIVLRDLVNHRFVYGRSATFWDPKPADRAAMQDTAKRIGRQLEHEVGFRGVFTVDGVMGKEGFVPTEVNTRYGAALSCAPKTESGDTIELILLNLAVIERRFDDIDLRPLESIVRDSMDNNRAGRAFISSPNAPDNERTAAIVRSESGGLVVDESPDRLEPSTTKNDAPEESLLATVEFGTTDGETGFAIVTFGQITPGPSAAPILIEVIEVLNEHWSLGVEGLQAAISVR